MSNVEQLDVGNFIFLGAPGAGKGTQASRVSVMLGLDHISTGDMIREAIRLESPLGKEIEENVHKGDLSSDGLVLTMLKKRLQCRESQYHGILLDGFPRTFTQAEALEGVLRELGLSLHYVCFLDISDEEALRRLTGRFSCQECGKSYHQVFIQPKEEGVCDLCGAPLERREDDEKSVILNRLATYHQQTAPLIKFYERKGVLKRVNAEQSE